MYSLLVSEAERDPVLVWSLERQELSPSLACALP